MSPRRAPSADEIAAIAQAELARIPRELRRFVANVAIRVEDLPDEETEREMALESPFDLLGLYQGVALDEQSVADVRHDVDHIVLYRRPILDYWCETGETLESIVRHVLIHEIGHHFGFSDEDMERLESDG